MLKCVSQFRNIQIECRVSNIGFEHFHFNRTLFSQNYPNKLYFYLRFSVICGVIFGEFHGRRVDTKNLLIFEKNVLNFKWNFNEFNVIYFNELGCGVNSLIRKRLF